ncbi:unnamed protein product [Musa acuminata subsp. burmannicoides]
MIAAFPSFPLVSAGALSILASEAVALCWLLLPSFLLLYSSFFWESHEGLGSPHHRHGSVCVPVSGRHPAAAGEASPGGLPQHEDQRRRHLGSCSSLRLAPLALPRHLEGPSLYLKPFPFPLYLSARRS